VRQVLGWRTDDSSLILHPAPDLADWQSFCVENYDHAGRRLTIVWDAPDAPSDAYDDGDKGFTIYDGDTSYTDRRTCRRAASRSRRRKATRKRTMSEPSGTPALP
jgi:hypothetical protein